MSASGESALSALEQAQAAFDKAPNALIQPWSQELVRFLSIDVLGFSCLAIVLSAVLLWRTQASPSQVLKVFGVLSIVGFSALLLVVGYSNEQLTPIVGLFGAIAGYLLGKDTSPSKT